MKNSFWLRLIRYLPSIIWMLVIFYFSSQQTTGIGTNATDRFLILKSFHVIEYAALGILLFYGFKKYKYAIITAYLYAVSDELHQYFVPGRTSRFRDTMIDLLGISLGLLILKLFLKKNKAIARFFL